MAYQITTQREANARLIAAAPDMLTALKDVRGMILHYQHDMPTSILAELETISAAIAKAEGKS